MPTTIKPDLPLLLKIVGHMRGNVNYRLGAKIPPTAIDWTPYRYVDCSGAVRYWLQRCANFDIGDGSVQQHDLIKARGFKESDVASAKRKDGVLRIAFLAPKGGEPGHVALVLDGETIESHGGVGPDRRPWTGTGWQAKTKVYCLTLG